VVRVRRARPGDLDALAALEHASFALDRLAVRQWRRHLASDSAAIWVVEHGGAILGSALVFYRRGSRVARLYSLAVDRSARGCGIGALLVDRAERDARRRRARSMVLEVRLDNAAAQALYRRAGYHCFARRHGYYEDGRDALRYRKDLGAAPLTTRPAAASPRSRRRPAAPPGRRLPRASR
jgi:ribosomal protein S18 acetylase RimI-like enzyme